MPTDPQSNLYWATINLPPSNPTTATSVRVPPGQLDGFPPPPFAAVVSPAGVGNAVLQDGPDTAEPLRVTAIVGNVLTLEREVALAFRRQIRVGDWVFASLVTGP